MRWTAAGSGTLAVAVLLATAGTGCDSERSARRATPVTEALGGIPAQGFRRAHGPRPFHFPADHGAHPDYRNEWWYFTGNLADAGGRRFGFQLTLFRIALAPPGQRTTGASAWRASQVYMGHFAVSDIDGSGDRFRAFERFARGAAGLAGARNGPTTVWLESWRIVHDGAGNGRWHLEADADGVLLTLELEAVDAIIRQGDDGFSRKCAEPGNASYYYSIPRLRAAGTLVLDGRRHVLTGEAWLDREWSTSALCAGQAGWDWFSLRLADGSELMYYRLRDESGATDPFSAGSHVGADGRITRLDADDVSVTVLEEWDSPRGGRYPAAWRLTAAVLGRPLEIRPLLADQELDLAVRYWEGAVQVLAGGEPAGVGYVELTGYAR